MMHSRQDNTRELLNLIFIPVRLEGFLVKTARWFSLPFPSSPRTAESLKFNARWNIKCKRDSRPWFLQADRLLRCKKLLRFSRRYVFVEEGAEGVGGVRGERFVVGFS